jgi:rubrerythrin
LDNKKRPNEKEIKELTNKRINYEFKKGWERELLMDILFPNVNRNLLKAMDKYMKSGFQDIKTYIKDLEGVTIEEMQSIFTFYNKEGKKVFLGNADNWEL